ncbi:hypothetical protein, partial [Xylella fastidiosa]|uniref:hypothetical protein n=1 Tax=Xylella fastidiosa TaxID=2371 RepID=UPI0028802D1B
WWLQAWVVVAAVANASHILNAIPIKQCHFDISWPLPPGAGVVGRCGDIKPKAKFTSIAKG